MPGTLIIDQRFKSYPGTAAEIMTAINADLAAKDLWFIKQMGVLTAGQGIVAWVLWEKQTRG